MAETTICSVMARTRSDVSLAGVAETLRAQQQLLQKLYTELDEERESSATATSEAMDMILRLQGEKAVVEMEANQYKRMAEEKIGHAEATLEAFEELVYHKEMEIASLEFQVQAYKHKLESLGCDFNASEYVHLNTSDQQNGENDQTSTVRRQHSMPPIPFKKTLRVAGKRERSPSPAPVSCVNLFPKVVLENTDKVDLTRKSVDFVFGSGSLDSYWNKIKMLDEKVRMISDCNVGERSESLSSRKGKSCSIFSQASSTNTIITCDQTERLDSTNSDDELNQDESTQDRKAVADHPSLLNVHDVFEVPQARGKHGVSDNGRKRLEKWNSEADNRLTKPGPVSDGMIESSVKHDADKQKGVDRVHREIKTHSLKDLVTIIGKKKERMDVDFNSQAEFQKLHQRVARLERERRISTRHEISCEEDGEEQLRLLKDIQNQLKLIQSDMRSCKTIEAAPADDVSLAYLQEAMLHFWL